MADAGSTNRGSKRQRVDEEGGSSSGGNEDAYVKLSTGLQNVMGQRKYCKQSELTRDILLQYLKETDEISEAEIIAVKVASMGGIKIETKIQAGTSVNELKMSIQERHGISAFDQQLFRMRKEAAEEQGSMEALIDSYILDTSCSLALVVQGEHKVGVSNTFVFTLSFVCVHMTAARKGFMRTGKKAVISGDGRCIITQQEAGCSVALTNIVVDATTGPVYVEFKVLSGRSRDQSVLGRFGALVQNTVVDLDGDPVAGSNNDAYFMKMSGGQLYGNGKHGSDKQGDALFKVGDRAGVLVKVGDQGFVRFFQNGNELGSGFRAGEEIKDLNGSPTGKVLGQIKSPLVIAVAMARMWSQGQSYQLIPHAALPAGAV